MTRESRAPVELLGAKSDLPREYMSSLRKFWLIISRPRTQTAWLRERYGELVTIRSRSRSLRGQVWVYALSAEGARQILLADPAGYDPFWKEGFTGLAGPGSLWVLSGNRHRQERQLLSPPFHARGFSSYGENIREITRRKTETWQPGQTVRALDTTLSISMDVIMQLVFGVEEGVSFMQEGRRVLSALWRAAHPLIVFFPQLQRPWFPLWRRHTRARDDFSDWLGRHLSERRARTQESDDVLGRMLAARHEDGSHMQDEDIRDELYTILLAGHETTATALAWALYELGSHPAELQKLRAELAALGPDSDPGSVVKLPYLSAVCSETLRLHTILAEVARVITAPLQLSEYTIPPGASVIISIMAIHHDPALYPDPDEFIPERFIERTYSMFEFLPFGGGHRRCLGAALSDYEFRIALAEIVTHWEFEPAAVEREIRRDIAMGSSNGVRLRIRARRLAGATSSANSQTDPRPVSEGAELAEARMS